MAPVTRRQRRLSNASPPADAAASPANGANGHIRFSSPASDAPLVVVRDGVSRADKDVIANGVGDDSVVSERDVDEEPDRSQPAPASEDAETDDGEESDDEAPEAVTADSARAAARKRDEDAQAAVEAQRAAERQKRKRRDAQLKEQAQQRKRQKTEVQVVVPAGKPAEEADTDAAAAEGNATEDEGEKALAQSAAPKPAKEKKKSNLLPNDLLAQLAAAPPPKAGQNPNLSDTDDDSSAASDNDGDGDGEIDDFDDMDMGGLNMSGALAALSNIPDNAAVTEKKRAKARRKREHRRQKARMEARKGPVSVRVLEDSARSRKVLSPKTSRNVTGTRDGWLNRRGVERREVRVLGGGFGRR